MSRQLVVLVAVGLVGVASSMGVSAQEARLVLRDAIVVRSQVPAAQPNRPFPAPPRRANPPEIDVRGDTTGMVRAELDGYIVYLGDVLLPLGEGSLLVAGVDEDPLTNQPKVSLELAEAEAERFAEITAERIEQAIALVLDGRVLSAPTVQGRIPNGRVEITGDTWDEANDLAAALRDATGAASPEDEYAERRLAARGMYDASSPKSAATAFLQAVDLKDWVTVADLFHPDALALMRWEAEQMVEVRANKAMLVVGVDGNPVEPGAVSPVIISDLLEREPTGATLDAYSDADLAALLMTLLRGRTPDNELATVSGVLSLREGLAYAVVEPAESPWLDEPGVSRTRLLTLRRVGDSWRVLIPEQGW